MTRNKENKELEEFKYLIDSRNLTSKERREESEAIMKARKARLHERTESDILAAKLMQLKYRQDVNLNPNKSNKRDA